MKKQADNLVATSGSLAVDSHIRTFVSVSPSDLAAGAALMIVFHGSYQTGQTVRAFAGGAFDQLAAREKLVVVYPDAYKKLWNDARIVSNYPARLEGYDDVAFFRALVAHFVETAGVDPNRVYAAGYSNGAQFVNRLIHEAGAELAGAAMIAATQPVPENFPTGMPVTPLPVVLIHGTGDRLVPYGGGMASFWGVRPRGLGLSHLETAEYLAGRNGISTPPTTSVLPSTTPGKTAVIQRDWSEPGKRPVRSYTIEGGGHVIPNPAKRAAAIYGRTNQDLDSGQAIWKFFTESEQSGRIDTARGAEMTAESVPGD